jgi:hypothetical protein
MNIKVDLPNPKVCIGCPCNQYEEGREYCSLIYWDWTNIERVWYNEFTKELLKLERDEIIVEEPGKRIWIEVPRRPPSCIKELGE